MTVTENKLLANIILLYRGGGVKNDHPRLNTLGISTTFCNTLLFCN